MVRVIAGRARGRRLAVPAGDRVRPTADRVREALFNALAHRLGQSFEGLDVLDLCAGSGALGLEALSRGARRVCLVEADATVAAVTRKNADLVGAADGQRVEVIRAAAERFLEGRAETFDVVFIDPPYAAGLVPLLLARLSAGWLANDALICVETAGDDTVEAPPGRVVDFTRRYGDTALTILSEAPMRSALYPGSFDPVTNGHVDIVRRSVRMFDRVVVAVATNIRKQPLFSDEQRVSMLREVFAGEPKVEVDTFSGLLVDYARRRGVATVLRGLRAVSDFEYEFQMASMNRRLSDEVDYIFMMTSEAHYYVSSTLIREVAANGGSVSGMVPPTVEAALYARFGRAP